MRLGHNPDLFVLNLLCQVQFLLHESHVHLHHQDRACLRYYTHFDSTKWHHNRRSTLGLEDLQDHSHYHRDGDDDNGDDNHDCNGDCGDDDDGDGEDGVGDDRDDGVGMRVCMAGGGRYNRW